jgi:hypothetical protein
MPARLFQELKMVKLICALPNPGCAGVPRGLFYRDDEEGQRRAEAFAKQEDRPGWGVFEPVELFHDDADEKTFAWVLEQNGFKRG